MDMKQTLFELSSSCGLSGEESCTAERAKQILSPFVDTVNQDTMGNLIGQRKAKTNGAKTIVLDAHLDEVGLIVTGHEAGFLKFTAIGVDPRILPGLEVKILSQPPRFGVVTCPPPHLAKDRDEEKAFEMDQMRIDCGLPTEDAIRLIPVGTRVAYGTKPFLLGEKSVCGKSLDDRACFVILCRVMELLRDEELPVNIYVVGSVQEEYTGLGAATAGYRLVPDEAIIVDVSFADTPDSPSEDTSPLGSGPMIGVGPVLNRRMSSRMKVLAEANKIPYTVEVLPSWTGTNADDLQMSRQGVAVSCISLPLRYMHTPLESVDLDDMEHCAQLIAAYIRSRGEE